MKEYKFKAIIQKNEDMDASYIIFPYDIKKEFGKGRVKVKALFNNIKYLGSIVNMGIKDKNNNLQRLKYPCISQSSRKYPILFRVF